MGNPTEVAALPEESVYFKTIRKEADVRRRERIENTCRVKDSASRNSRGNFLGSTMWMERVRLVCS